MWRDTNRFTYATVNRALNHAVGELYAVGLMMHRLQPTTRLRTPPRSSQIEPFKGRKAVHRKLRFVQRLAARWCG